MTTSEIIFSLTVLFTWGLLGLGLLFLTIFAVIYIFELVIKMMT